jgi:hypothetical protein
MELSAASTADARREEQAQALVLYHALRRELSRLDEELSPREARAMLLRALNLLPGLRAVAGERPHQIEVEQENDPRQRARVNVQDAVDSLRAIWRDYQLLLERESGRNRRPSGA